MAEAALWITFILVAVTIAGILAFPYYVQLTRTMENQKKVHKALQSMIGFQPVVSTSPRGFEGVDDQSKDKPGEFKLLVEERSIVESIAGNENLEIQWRLATLSEAKAVVTHYHGYLSENSLIKSMPEHFALPAPHSVTSKRKKNTESEGAPGIQPA